MTAGVLLVFLRHFNLCTHPCPYRLARLGTSLRIRGKLIIRKKEIIVFIRAKPKNNEMNHTKSVSRFMETKGKHASFKPSTDDGKQVNHFSRSGATL